jgi:addiction module HigA family antidote
MPMKKPPHPGRSIKDACLEPLGLTVTEGAAVLGVARHTLSRVINGQAGVSSDMAIRLEKAFGGSADTWSRMQAAYDLAQARQHEREIDVRRYAAA